MPQHALQGIAGTSHGDELVLGADLCQELLCGYDAGLSGKDFLRQYAVDFLVAVSTGISDDYQPVVHIGRPAHC